MSNVKLSWPDIFVDPSTLDFSGLLALLPRTVSGRLRPIGASVFGDCFFERPSGQIEILLEGGIHLVAENMDEFRILMNAVSWQKHALLTQGIALLIERGIARPPHQFFSFVPHPASTGKIDWDTVRPMDAYVWHSICAQILD
jgi:hypothetical protein